MGVQGVGGGNLEEGWELRPGHKMRSKTTQNGPRAAVASSGSVLKISYTLYKMGNRTTQKGPRAAVASSDSEGKNRDKPRPLDSLPFLALIGDVG